MTFFPGSSCMTISGGTFTNNLLTQDAGRCTSRNSDGLMIVQDYEVDLRVELISGSGYRIHSALHGERIVALRTFEGPRAKQDWTDNMALCRKVFHPNVLKIVGVSEESSNSHFVLFRGITSEQKMQSLIAKALRIDLNTSVQLSMKAVKGIAAGLSYLKSQNTLMHAGGLNFDILTGYENEPIISFHPSTTTHDDGSVPQNFDMETRDRGIEVLNRLCQQLFSGANSILYDDFPERNFDAYDREGHLTVNAEDTPNLSESEAISKSSSSTEQSKSSPTPRREVWWLDLGATNQCLESIKRRFEDCLDRVPISSSNSLLRRIRSPKDNNLRWDLHQCRGYLREEITLTSDVSRSAIVSHAFPSQSELCSICGQLVKYTYSDPSITDAEIELSEDLHQEFDGNQVVSSEDEIPAEESPRPRLRLRTSWSTWYPDPDTTVSTPSSVEPTLMFPDRLSPGLFGPRTPESPMYDVDWRPDPPTPDPEPAEAPVFRPAWRPYHPRGKKERKAPQVALVPAAPVPQRPQPGPSHILRQQPISWSTWHPDPDTVLTPPSVEPTLMVPDRVSPGLSRSTTPDYSKMVWYQVDPDTTVSTSLSVEPTLMVPDRVSPGLFGPRTPESPMYDVDWHPDPPMPDPEPAEAPVFIPAWRPYHPREKKKKKEPQVAPIFTPAWRPYHPREKKKKEPQVAPVPGAHAPQPQPGPSDMDRRLRQQVTSWSTWHPDTDTLLTSPSVEPTLMVPDRLSPGLFGPRSPESPM